MSDNIDGTGGDFMAKRIDADEVVPLGGPPLHTRVRCGVCGEDMTLLARRTHKCAPPPRTEEGY